MYSMKTLCLKSCLQCDKPKYQLVLSYIFKDRSNYMFCDIQHHKHLTEKKLVLPTTTINYINLSNKELRDRVRFIHMCDEKIAIC